MSGPSSLRLTCFDVEQCVVYIEPWGSEHVLRRGDAFRISSDAFAKGRVEVSVVPNGISLTFESDDEVTMTDKSGAVLSV